MRHNKRNSVIDENSVFSYSFGTSTPVDYKSGIDKNMLMQKIMPVINNSEVDSNCLPFCEFAVKAALSEAVSKAKKERQNHKQTISSIINEETGVREELIDIRNTVETILETVGREEGISTAVREE